jgi:hypothetical protein
MAQFFFIIHQLAVTNNIVFFFSSNNFLKQPYQLNGSPQNNAAFWKLSRK